MFCTRRRLPPSSTRAARLNRALFVTTSETRVAVKTVERRRWFARSHAKRAFFRERTAVPSLLAAKRKPSASPLSAGLKTPRDKTTSKRATISDSCCTISSRPHLLARPDESAARLDARSVTVTWPSARWRPSCRARKTFRSCADSRAPSRRVTVRPQWRPCARARSLCSTLVFPLKGTCFYSTARELARFFFLAKPGP